MKSLLLFVFGVCIVAACAAPAAPSPPSLPQPTLTHVAPPTPTAPSIGAIPSPWYASAIHLPRQLPHLTHPVIIAVVDTGIDSTHPALRNQISLRMTVVEAGGGDPQGHGTHTAGLVVSRDPRAPGICPACRLIDVKAIHASGYGSDSTVAHGITGAIAAGARIINLSVGGSNASDTMYRAIEHARQRDVLVVAAAGNQPHNVTYPAAYPDVLAVSAIDRNHQPALFAPHGDIVAPGVDIINTSPFGLGFSSESGTSAAAAQVSAAAGLVRSLRPDLSATQTRELLLRSATDLGPTGPDAQFGYGLLNVRALLDALQDPLLTQRGSIHGRIQGTTAPHIRIELVNGDHVYPDAEGFFRFTGLKAGTYQLQVIGLDQAIQMQALTIPISGIGLHDTQVTIHVNDRRATAQVIRP
jgi:hypothetical protein